MEKLNKKNIQNQLPLIESLNLNEIKDGTEFIHPQLNKICFKIGWLNDEFLFAEKNTGTIHSTQTPRFKVLYFLD